MASFASSATTGGARKHAWTNIYYNFNDVLKIVSLALTKLERREKLVKH